VVDVEFDPVGQSIPFCDDDRNLVSALVLGTRDFIRKRGLETAAVLLDGTLSSGAAAAIAADALGPSQVLGVALKTSSADDDHLLLAEALARAVGIELCVYDAEHWMSLFRKEVARLVTQGVVTRTDDLDATDVLSPRMLLETIAHLNRRILINTDSRTLLTLCAPTPVGGDFAVFKELTQTRLLAVAARIQKDWGLSGRIVTPKAADTVYRFQSGEHTFEVPFDAVDLLLERYRQHGISKQTLLACDIDDVAARHILRRVALSEQLAHRVPPGIRISSTR
jgi:NAD+ synthase (glutamine-hydrolysing)